MKNEETQTDKEKQMKQATIKILKNMIDKLENNNYYVDYLESENTQTEENSLGQLLISRRSISVSIGFYEIGE